MKTNVQVPAGRARKPELSWLNVLFCILVVWIHTESAAVMSLNPASWQYGLVRGTQLLSFVSVYGFFFLSGLKLFLGQGKEKCFAYCAFYRKRSRSILLPYLIAVTLYELLLIWMHYIEFSPGSLLHYYVVGDLSSHFYFVVALVQLILLTPLFRWCVRRWSPVLLLPVAVVVTWISNSYLPELVGLFRPDYWFPYGDRVFSTYLVYYLAGCYAGANYERFCELAEQNLPLSTGLTAAFGALDVAAVLYSAASGTSINCTGLLHMGYLLCGILALFGWSRRLTVRCPQLPRPAAALDRVSYLVYLYHCAVLTWWNDWMGRSGITDAGVLLLLRAVVVYSVTIAGCLAWRALFRAGRAALERQKGGRLFCSTPQKK